MVYGIVEGEYGKLRDHLVSQGAGLIREPGLRVFFGGRAFYVSIFYSSFILNYVNYST